MALDAQGRRPSELDAATHRRVLSKLHAIRRNHVDTLATVNKNAKKFVKNSPRDILVNSPRIGSQNKQQQQQQQQQQQLTVLTHLLCDGICCGPDGNVCDRILR